MRKSVWDNFTFSQTVGYRERFSYGTLSLPEIIRAGDVSFEGQVVPTFCASTRRVHARLAPLVNDARRRRLSRGAVISSEIPPRGDDAALVHGATVALCQCVALYPRRLDTVHLPLALLQTPAIILFIYSYRTNIFFLSSKYIFFDLEGKGKDVCDCERYT